MKKEEYAHGLHLFLKREVVQAAFRQSSLGNQCTGESSRETNPTLLLLGNGRITRGTVALGTELVRATWHCLYKLGER